ncbi:hypothetical protein HYX17_05105 [Candidatus Woesearchaeota archaeon]|nr:hypothetical protein [Candidatus Woesearchaeota archaeon]
MITGVKPGIYRHKISHPYGDPEKSREYHRKIGRDPNSSIILPLSDALNDALDWHNMFLNGKESVDPHFTENPDEFFKMWMRGYSEERSPFSPLHKGFELHYISYDEEDPYHKIGDWKGMDDWGVLEGIIIVADLNGMPNRYNRYISLVINDFDKKRVLAYREKEYISEENQSRWKEKTLMNGEHPTDTLLCGSEMEEPKFPYMWSALSENTWTSVGFAPKEIYDSLRKLGFKFPE